MRKEPMAAYTLHSTVSYHTGGLRTLGWEMTLCNALDPPDSPCRQILRNPSSYGMLLHDFLFRLFPLQKPRRIVEIGGGYGYIMRDFLTRRDFDRIVMIDISPLLLERQMKTLQRQRIEYRCEDFLETPGECLAGIDIALMNENLGDFPTLTGWEAERLMSPLAALDPLEKEVCRYRTAYGLPPADHFPYALNIGALAALEKLCRAEIPLIFLAEHSCEAKVPLEYQSLISVRASGNPERITLCGHDEFTIRFSDLQALAQSFGYAVRRGPLADILPCDMTEALRRTLASRIVIHDRNEIIRHFLGDLYQYEYLVLSREAPEKRLAPAGDRS